MNTYMIIIITVPISVTHKLLTKYTTLQVNMLP